jgi:hypothetical protein
MCMVEVLGYVKRLNESKHPDAADMGNTLLTSQDSQGASLTYSLQSMSKTTRYSSINPPPIAPTVYQNPLLIHHPILFGFSKFTFATMDAKDTKDPPTTSTRKPIPKPPTTPAA